MGRFRKEIVFHAQRPAVEARFAPISAFLALVF